MKKNFEKRYVYDVDNRTVVAKSHFAGVEVTGTAKCHPDDNMDVKTGKKIASAKLSKKIADKRMKKSLARLKRAKIDLEAALLEYERASEYAKSAISEKCETEKRLQRILKTT